MVIFHSYVKLPEGIPSVVSCRSFQNPNFFQTTFPEKFVQTWRIRWDSVKLKHLTIHQDIRCLSQATQWYPPCAQTCEESREWVCWHTSNLEDVHWRAAARTRWGSCLREASEDFLSHVGINKNKTSPCLMLYTTICHLQKWWWLRAGVTGLWHCFSHTNAVLTPGWHVCVQLSPSLGPWGLCQSAG